MITGEQSKLFVVPTVEDALQRLVLCSKILIFCENNNPNIIIFSKNLLRLKPNNNFFRIKLLRDLSFEALLKVLL